MRELKWEDYVGDRLISRRNGFVVIVPSEHEQSAPLCCPICDYAFRNRDDEASYQEFGCCNICALEWAHGRKELWKNGWCPEPQQVIQSKQNRPRITVSITVT